jgi:tetratricopeptide (TPR) repeat protein
VDEESSNSGDEFRRLIKEPIDRARQAFQAGDHFETARILGETLPRITSPDMSIWWALLGVARVPCGDYQAGIDALERARRNPAEINAAGWGNLGIAYAKLGRLNDAREALEKGVEECPGDAALWMDLGVVWRKLKDPENAIRCHRNALAIDPTLAAAWHNLGNAYDDNGSLDEQLAALSEAVRLSPDRPDYWTALGVSYSKQRRYDRSLAAYSRAIELNSGYGDAWFNLTVDRCFQGNGAGAREAYRSLKELSSGLAIEFLDWIGTGDADERREVEVFFETGETPKRWEGRFGRLPERPAETTVAQGGANRASKDLCINNAIMIPGGQDDATSGIGGSSGGAAASGAGSLG